MIKIITHFAKKKKSCSVLGGPHWTHKTVFLAKCFNGFCQRLFKMCFLLFQYLFDKIMLVLSKQGYFVHLIVWIFVLQESLVRWKSQNKVFRPEKTQKQNKKYKKKTS